MRGVFLFAAASAVGLVGIAGVRAERPLQDRGTADTVVVGTVTAVYARETEGYREYVVEIRVEAAEKGTRVAKGDTFWAACYQRKEGKAGLQFDTSGHTAVPKEGQRIRAFVNHARGRNDGVYKNWFDALPAPKK